MDTTHNDTDTDASLPALCRVAEPIALTSILPYAFPLVKSFRIGHEDNAAFYAGILISSFALSESLTGFFWGAMSDRYGRRPILLLGCAGTMLSMLLMGFATNFWMALFGRALGGSLNATGKAKKFQTSLTGEYWLTISLRRSSGYHPDHGGRAGQETGARTTSICGHAIRLEHWHHLWPHDRRLDVESPPFIPVPLPTH